MAEAASHALANKESVAGKSLAGGLRHPEKSSRACWMRQDKLFRGLADGGHINQSQNLPSRLIFAMCSAASARKTGDIPELARADASMIAEEAREMRRLNKAELLANVAQAG